MKNFAEINRASTGAKKNFNFFEKLWEHSRTLRRVGLVLVMCLMAIPQMWASCGYYDNSGKKLQVCFSKDGSDWWANNGDSQASAGDIGTINKSLYLDWFLTYVWKDGSDISWTDFYYRIYKKGSTPPSFSTAFRGYWLDNIGGNNCKYGNNSDMAVNCFGSGVVPGATYVVEYYINTDCAGYLSNSSNNFKWEFTVPQRYLAADFTETTWSTTAYPLSDGSITIKDIAGNKTCNFCLTPNNTWDGKVYWNVGTGSTNPNGNVTLSDGGASDHNIRFTTPSGYRSDVTVSYDGNQVSVNCARRWTVTYHDDGKTSGSKPTDTNTYSNGTTVKVKDNTGLMVKTGKVFAGWATSSARATAGTVDYDPANSSNNTFSITQDMNLYPVWKNGCYLINGTTLNSSDFIVGTNGLQDNSYSVNGVTFSSKNFKFGSTKSSLKGQTYGAGTMLVYDTKKANTKITIYAYNNNNNNKNLYYQVIKEGESVSNDAYFEVANKSEGIYNLTINHSKGTRVVFCSNSGDLRICQMRVIEEGDPIKAVGEKGFQIAVPGRPFSTVSYSGAPYADLIDGVSLKNNTNTQLGQTTTYWDVRGTSGSPSTQYISFTTTEATQLQITTVNDDYNTFYLKKGSAALNTSTDATYSGKNTTININLSETGTWYILGTQAHIKKIAFDDFVAATVPTAFAATATTSTSVTLSITDGTNSKWEIYYNTTGDAPTASTAGTVITDKTPTVTGLTAGTDYYMWVRSVADYFNKSSWVALTGETFTTDTPSCEATAPGSISKGSASGGTGTITLTAAGDPATNNTWYWQSAADGTATNLGSGATKDVSATGTYYLRSYCSDNGGCWSDAVSVTVAAADLLTTPTATFSNSYYIIGGSSLDLSSLWTSDSEGSVTYSVPSAGGTGASISTAAFTATTAGTATVRASQAANGNYSAIYKDATITVLPGYATSIDFEDIIDVSGTSAAWKTTMEGQNYKLTQSDGSKWTLDDGTSGTKQADKGLKIKETGDNAGKIAFAVHANQTVELKVGTLAGTASGKASFSINGGASYSDITGASTASTGTPVTYTYKGNADRVYVFKTKSSSWNILQHITIGYKVTYDKGSNGTGTVDPMYKTHGTSLTLSSSTFSRDDYIQDGWSTIDGGDKVYDLGGSYTSNAEITLYPHWVVACTDPGLAYATGSVTKTLCDGSFTNTLTNNHSVAVTYTSSNTSVADVASDGAITIKAAGSTTITASSIAQTVSAVDYCADEASYTLTVSASTAAGLAYGTSTVKKDVGDDAFTNSLTNTHSLTVTYTSSDESVATVASNGAVTIKAAGTATITARSAQQEVSSTCYAAGEASYTLTVYPVYTVTYNAMGGTCGTSSANTNLGKVTLPSATHASYTTYEWVTSNGSSVGDADDDYEPSGNITLYAKWSGSCAGGGGSTTIYAMHMTAYNSYSNDESTTGTTTLAFASDNTVPVSDVVYYKPNSTNAIIVDFSTSAYTLQAGDVITFYCVSNNASEKNVGFTIHATSSGDAIGTANVNATNKARVAASYTVVAETALVGVNKIWCNRVGAETRFHDMTITRGGSSCHTVTYHGNGATSGYVNDPVQHTAGSDATVLYNDPTTGFKRTGYEFNGWNTKADASGTHYDYWDIDHRTIEDIAADVDLYAEWRIVIDADNTDFAGKDAPTEYKDVVVRNGATLTITKDTEIRDITVETGSTLNVSTNSGSAITLTANSLSLVGGWGTVGNETKYDMPRVYINPASKIERTDKTINFDINVDNRNYYPIALPFEVSMSDVTYKDDILAAAASERYGSIYAVKTYNGQNRADGAYPVWRLVSKSETLKPGHGYILCAVPALAWGHEKEIIRFPMKNVADEWLSNGELGHYTDGKSVEHIKDTVHVTAYKKEEGETAKSNIGWNLLGVPYMSCYTSDEIAASDDAALITGQLDINTGKYKDGDDNIYVSVPTYNFSEYVQENINDAVLLPGWCFFIQVEESGTLTFDKDGENLPIYAPKREKAMPTVKTGIILSGAGAKDKTTILVSDKYNAADYEINADLEKLFGEESFTLATYSLSGETRLAYNALSNADAANIIPIGYRAPADGEYTFSINPRYAENGAFEHVNLIDYETGIMTDLLMGSYTFSTERTQLDTRFALNVVPRQNTPTDIETVGGEGFDANAPRKVLINDKMYIIVDGKMYDATGKSVK